jgi:hypothetical protein
VSEADRERAAALAAEAEELLARKDYYAAKDRYEQSLELHEDAEVRKAYDLVLSAVGPD